MTETVEVKKDSNMIGLVAGLFAVVAFIISILHFDKPFLLLIGIVLSVIAISKKQYYLGVPCLIVCAVALMFPDVRFRMFMEMIRFWSYIVF